MKPPTAALHGSRLNLNLPPWYETGIDHFGPFNITANQKKWGLIFICLTTRAVHLEDVDGLGAEPFCHALDRFINRRGRPRILRSDQGTAFVSLDRHQEKTVQHYADELSAEVLKRFRIELHFNPAGTPHWGGSWERMIKEVKKILNSALSGVGTWRGGNFRTFLVRAEAILNHRPIAFDGDGEIIAPVHFLRPSAQVGLGPPLGAPNFTSLLQVRQAERIFWQKFTTYYLPTIAADRVLGEIRDHDLQEGDPVLLREGSNPLVDKWVTATIVETYPSQDGIVRSVLVDVEGDKRVRDITRIAVIDGPILERRKALQTSTAFRGGVKSGAGISSGPVAEAEIPGLDSGASVQPKPE
jgi:hypothetical protein